MYMHIKSLISAFDASTLIFQKEMIACSLASLDAEVIIGV